MPIRIGAPPGRRVIKCDSFSSFLSDPGNGDEQIQGKQIKIVQELFRLL